MNRESVCLRFFAGEDENAEQSEAYSDASGLPRIGDHVAIWGTRDGDGEYVHATPVPMMAGRVSRIEHVYEQRGSSSGDWQATHYVAIFLMQGGT